MNLKVSEEEIARRRAAWNKPEPKIKKGVLLKYIRSVSNAAEGCVTDGL